MIVRLRGQLTEIAEDRVVIERDGLAYEVLVANYGVSELASLKGEQITLHTMQHLEGNAVGGNLIPRMIGFLRPEERAFFRLFVKVKGMGVKKGLRALATSVSHLAAAIETGDTAALTRLPGIGRRMAETIVAELKGKVNAFLLGPAASPDTTDRRFTDVQNDAVEILVAWGDSRADALRWVSQLVQSGQPLGGPEEWVRAAYRIKSGGKA